MKDSFLISLVSMGFLVACAAPIEEFPKRPDTTNAGTGGVTIGGSSGGTASGGSTSAGATSGSSGSPSTGGTSSTGGATGGGGGLFGVGGTSAGGAASGGAASGGTSSGGANASGGSGGATNGTGGSKPSGTCDFSGCTGCTQWEGNADLQWQKAPCEAIINCYSMNSAACATSSDPALCGERDSSQQALPCTSPYEAAGSAIRIAAADAIACGCQ